MIRKTNVYLLFCSALVHSIAFAHEYVEQEISFSCSVAELAGTVTLPTHMTGQGADANKQTCVVLVGGTLSQTRDGQLVRDGVPNRDAIRRMAHMLAYNGYASIRYDKVGFGNSKAAKDWTGSYVDEVRLVTAAVERARQLASIERVVIVGESAGAYVACLAAKAGTIADAYVFLGGHCDSGQSIYEYNFGRLVQLAEKDRAWKALAESQLRSELAMGRTYRQMFQAATDGSRSFEMVDGDYRRTVDLTRRKEELDMPPNEMFRYITTPALAVSGEYDLNVSPDHAARIVSTLRTAGNHACTCVMISGADHSFQVSPADAETRLRQRYSLESFSGEYSQQLYNEVILWLNDRIGRMNIAKAQTPAAIFAMPKARAVAQLEIDPKSDSTPKRIHLAPGIQIVENITDRQQTTGVQTLEGEIGPLLLGVGSQAHYIDMPAGMYCEEHPHSTESIIYTVRGQWVLCSHGRRQVMKPGSLFHFAPGTPTGYEIPFSENAFILIFKGDRTTNQEEEFITYLKGMAQRLEREHVAGIPYLLSDLKDDHPAILFAKKVNPTYGH